MVKLCRPIIDIELQMALGRSNAPAISSRGFDYSVPSTSARSFTPRLFTQIL